MEEANELKKLISENDEFLKMMNHPQITREEKVKIITEIFDGRLSDDMTGLLKLLVMNGRVSELESVIDYFIAEIKEYKKIGIAYVVTPIELNDTQKGAVESKLLETTEYETMEMNYSVDSSLIGGMTIRIGDRVVDSSVKSKLDKLTKELRTIRLATS